MQQIPPYQRVEFEQRAYREQGKSEKKLLTRDQALLQVRRNGFERLPFMREVFSFLFADLESKLNETEAAIAGDMRDGFGELCHEVVRVDDENIVFYDDAENLVFDKREYDDSRMTFTDKRVFSLNGLKPNTFYLAAEVYKRNPDLGKFIWSRKHEDLPAGFENGGGFLLPRRGIVRPVARGNVVYGIYDDGASRGVRRAKNLSVTE